MFNEGRYWERVQAGELVVVPIHEGKPMPDKEQPSGTKTVTVSIRDHDGSELAHAHGFIQPGGIIGASGLMDPKTHLERREGLSDRQTKESACHAVTT